MARLRLFAAATVLLATAMTTAAWAGTVVVAETWAYDQYSESGTATLFFGENKLRVEFAGKEGTEQAIFDVENPSEPVIWMIDATAQTYTKMDLKTLKKEQDQIQQMIEQFENYTAKLSAEEKAEIAKQYKKQLRQADDLLKYEERMKKTTYQKIAGGEKVGTWTCDHLKGMFNKEMRKEVWVAPWKEVGLEPADVAVLVSVANAFKGWSVGETLPFVGQKVEGSDSPIDGLPVKAIYYEDGNKIVREEVKEIRKEDLAPGLFTIPEGFTEKEPGGN
jgi:hypothetical protein